MPFLPRLRESLQTQGRRLPSDSAREDRLEHVLDRLLLAVEQNFDGELATSVLLLSDDGKRLSHGAGPSLPRAYRGAIDGAAIGPRAGSCGAAAFFGRPVYVSDIASDPLWADYRHLALAHGFRSCWSTPIRDREGAVIATFATYHRAVGGPTREEVEAIATIAKHVADAILWERGVQDLGEPEMPRVGGGPRLTLVVDDGEVRLLAKLDRMQELAATLDRQAEAATSKDAAAAMRATAAHCRQLVGVLRLQIELSAQP
jgi:hypothetical protein